MCSSYSLQLHHFSAHIAKILLTVKGGRRSHVSFCLYFERHVKHAGRARVNYSLGFHCHLEFEIRDYRIFWLKNVFAQAQSGAKVFI